MRGAERSAFRSKGTTGGRGGLSIERRERSGDDDDCDAL